MHMGDIGMLSLKGGDSNVKPNGRQKAHWD